VGQAAAVVGERIARIELDRFAEVRDGAVEIVFGCKSAAAVSNDDGSSLIASS
jgi:hypothetical protein